MYIYSIFTVFFMFKLTQTATDKALNMASGVDYTCESCSHDGSVSLPNGINVSNEVNAINHNDLPLEAGCEKCGKLIIG